MKICSIDDCHNSCEINVGGRKGMCSTHYQRIKKYGDPNFVKYNRPAKDFITKNANYSSNECLTWPFHIAKDGYGRVSMPNNGHLTTASRLMCMTAHGNPPTDRHECAHSCGNGNKGCVNPRHLYWATPTQNQADRVIHGTSNRGTNQWKSKLTEKDVLEIRNLLGTETQTSIARRYNVDPSLISDIKRRKKWAWLD